MALPPRDPRLELFNNRILELEAAIRAHRDARGDDRCWLDDIELYKALGADEVPKPELLALTNKDAFMGRCRQYWEHRQKPDCKPWRTVEQLEKRIEELVAILNSNTDDARLKIENERDACERAVQFLIDSYKEAEDDDHVAGLEHARDVIAGRKNPMVKLVAEMGQGTLIGEFVQKCVEEALTSERAERQGVLERVEAAWRGFHTRGGATPEVARERGDGSLAWLQEQLEAIFRE